MLTGITRAAELSPCGLYRWTLSRRWDDALPVLLVAMFGPSDADHQVDDPTITLVCQVAAHNGFGGIVVVNGIPLRNSKPGPQYAMLDWERTSEWSDRDRLQDNLAVIRREVARAGAVLLAWGAMADRCADWFDLVLEQIREELPAGCELYCLGKTKAGYPKHPLARGKHKVRCDTVLQRWVF
jgi:hypothetical protein